MYSRIILDDVALTHLTFSTEFTSAVEQKQIAEQKAEMARYRVEQAEQIKIANVIRAEGDAEAAKLVSDVSYHFTKFRGPTVWPKIDKKFTPVVG